MKKFLLVWILLNGLSALALDDLLKVRQLFYNATTSKQMSDSFCVYLNTSPQISASLLNGYRGMSYMIKANYSLNPYNKINFFIKGKGYLDRAIERDSKNIELLFLRFCVQSNAPFFLSYDGNIDTDKKVIMTGYDSLKDKDLKNRIRNYMVNSSKCSIKEKAFFK